MKLSFKSFDGDTRGHDENEIYTFFVSKSDCEKDMRLSIECLEDDIQAIKSELDKLLEI